MKRSPALRPGFAAARARQPSDGGWGHLGGDPLPKLRLGDRQFVGGLQIEPEPRAVAEMAGEPQRGLGRNAAFAVQNVSDAARRRPEREGERVGGED
jgi:hypothetical protein